VWQEDIFLVLHACRSVQRINACNFVIISAKATAMSARTRKLIESHWEHANARLWPEFSRLIHSELRYEVPQTREYIDSGAGYIELFKTWSGDWRAVIRELVCEDAKAVCVIDFITGAKIETGISVIELRDELICAITEYWPEPYEPPLRATTHLKRRAG
jgi:hypothetical protein